jgi:hypothetical protein
MASPATSPRRRNASRAAGAFPALRSIPISKMASGSGASPGGMQAAAA